MTRPADPGIHVLVVDDSAVVRRFMSSVLTQERGLTVDTAADPLFAMQKMVLRRPDVILLDIEMPRMNGLTFLRKVMAEDPIPVIICSGHAGEGTRTALEALGHGAVEIITKPQHGVQEFLQESAVMLFDVVRAAAQANVSRAPRRAAPPTASVEPAGRPATLPASSGVELIAIGSSTGGPEALQTILAALPASMPPMVIAQHMPKKFTAALAERLNGLSQLGIREAEEGDRVLAGRALIAPGDRHLIVVRHGDERIVRLVDGPLVSRHRPSVDVLFRSVARSTGPGAVGLILTGMGDDGVQGLAEMRSAGATTIAQDEATSVVFGMPRLAAERGAAERVAPLTDMAALLVELAGGGEPRAAGGEAR